MKDAFYISADKSKLDLELIHKFLSNDGYWTIGRTLETIETSNQHAYASVYTKTTGTLDLPEW